MTLVFITFVQDGVFFIKNSVKRIVTDFNVVGFLWHKVHKGHTAPNKFKILTQTNVHSYHNLILKQLNSQIL